MQVFEKSLSNVQIELLKLYANDVKDKQLEEMKFGRRKTFRNRT
jgi:hypothetical protein